MTTTRAAGSPAAAAAAGALLVLVLTAARWSSADGRGSVPAMYVFGDSLVDDGNNDFLPPPAPRAVPPCGVDLPSGVPRRSGRFTNSYNLADIIGQYVGFNMSPPAYLAQTQAPFPSNDLLAGRVGVNYASGGSGILDATWNGTLTLREQVQLFAETKARIAGAGVVGRRELDRRLARSLFVISSGGNDFNAFDEGLPKSAAPEFIAGMVAAYIDRIKELYELGARRLAILDILPVGCLPSQRAITSTGECDAFGNSLSEMFNALLRAELASAAAAAMPYMRYSVASTYNVFLDMIANPKLAGVKEVARACCGGGRFNGEEECTAAASLCADRDDYLFWDMSHGTQATYRRAVHDFFYGPARHADPINLAHLLDMDEEPPLRSLLTAPATYLSSSS